MYLIRADMNGQYYNAGVWRNKHVASLLCYIKNSRARKSNINTDYTFFEVVKER